MTAKTAPGTVITVNYGAIHYDDIQVLNGGVLLCTEGLVTRVLWSPSEWLKVEL